MKSKVIFLIWASWVGKTTILEWVKSKDISHVVCLNADSRYGIPDEEAMVQEAWSVSERRNQSLLKCLEKALSVFPWKTIVLDKSTHIDLIWTTCEKLEIATYQIILVDCEEQEMRRRLLEERQQPELVTDDMFNRQRILREQATQKWITILDTTWKTKEECVEEFLHKITE